MSPMRFVSTLLPKCQTPLSGLEEASVTSPETPNSNKLKLDSLFCWYRIKIYLSFASNNIQLF